ncbi:MAG: transaminase [Stellaceae bacterium]
MKSHAAVNRLRLTCSETPPAMPNQSKTDAVSRVDHDHVGRMFAGERARFDASHGKSKDLFARGKESFLYGTPSHWMRRWSGGFPIYVAEASGTRLVDVDGNVYTDFCLGDTGGMCGHGHPAIANAVAHQLRSSASTMLPTAASLWVGEELTRRFGLPYWNLATSATDANRAAIRLSRMITGRDKVLVFNGCYHGAVEEAHVELRDGRMGLRNDIHPNGVDHQRVSKVVEFNDRDALQSALAPRDVACVLTEPAMTNCGMVLPDPGYHDFLRTATRQTGTVLIIDETYTISAGPGGFSLVHGLEPDIFVIGKAIGGGIPCAVYGLSRMIAERVWTVFPPVDPAVKQSAHGGFGGTLAGNAIAVAAIEATLKDVLTYEAFARMIGFANDLADDAVAQITEAGLAWQVSRIGVRVEYMFHPRRPHNGGEARAARDGALEILLHLYFLNRGVILTPFHNMLLLCPASSSEDVDHHRVVFATFIAELMRR